jgi:hypothetical protein
VGVVSGTSQGYLVFEKAVNFLIRSQLPPPASVEVLGLAEVLAVKLFAYLKLFP